MSPTCQPANQRRGPVSKGEFPNLLGLYSRSYPTTSLNHFFLWLRLGLPDSSDRLLRGLRAASGHGGEASVWALQTLTVEGSTIPGSGGGS